MRSYSESIYELLRKEKIETIYDDRDSNLGKKINDWELIGVPNILIIGKSESENKTITYKERLSNSKFQLNVNELCSKLI